MFRRHNKHSQVPTVALFSFGEMKAISAYYINSLSLANILWVGLVLMFPSVRNTSTTLSRHFLNEKKSLHDLIDKWLFFQSLAIFSEHIQVFFTRTGHKGEPYKNFSSIIFLRERVSKRKRRIFFLLWTT